MTKPGFRKSGSRKGDGDEGRHDWAPDGRPSFSRTQIQHLIRTEFARGRRHGYPVTCVLITIDRLSDRVMAFGDAVRRAALQVLHRVVHESSRSTDHLGLVDGDRFLLVLSHTTVWDGERVAERIRAGFAEMEVAVDGQDLAMTLSAGLSGAAPPDPPLFETVMAKAEGALERAARSGNTIQSVP